MNLVINRRINSHAIGIIGFERGGTFYGLYSEDPAELEVHRCGSHAMVCPAKMMAPVFIYNNINAQYDERGYPMNPKGTVTCHRCGAKVAVELQKLPPEQCGGRDNFWFYEVECPNCGRELEGVLEEKV